MLLAHVKSGRRDQLDLMLKDDQVLVHAAYTVPDSCNWTKCIQQVQFMETEIWYTYWYNKTFSCGLLFLSFTNLFSRTYCPLFRCLAFVHGFPFPYGLPVVFSRFYWCHEVGKLFVILCVLCLSNAGLMCSAFPSTPFEFAGFVIFRDIFVWVLCFTNIGFVQCFSLNSL